MTTRRSVSLLMMRSVSAEYPLTLAMCSTKSSVHLHQLHCVLFVIYSSSSLCSWACFSSCCINADSVRPSIHQNINRACFALDSTPTHPSSSDAQMLSADARKPRISFAMSTCRCSAAARMDVPVPPVNSPPYNMPASAVASRTVPPAAVVRTASLLKQQN